MKFMRDIFIEMLHSTEIFVCITEHSRLLFVFRLLMHELNGINVALMLFFNPVFKPKMIGIKFLPFRGVIHFPSKAAVN